MEIAVQLNCISYYHNTKAIYASGEILESRILEPNHKNIHHFQTAPKGEKINLKCTEKTFAEVSTVLQDKIVKFHICKVEIPNDFQKGFKFVFDSAESCAILQEN